MARINSNNNNNKYTSINFNHIYDKTNLSSAATATTTSKYHQATPSSAASSSSLSFYSTNNNNKNNKNPTSNLFKNPFSHPGRTSGRMLVLTRPAPKPISAVAVPEKVSPLPEKSVTQQPADPEYDSISLRPLGRTGAGAPVLEVPAVAATMATRTEKFVPPHLRPGFVGREERPGPEVFRGKDGSGGQRQQQMGYFGSPGRYGEDGRPMSGGHERMRRGGDSDPGFMIRPGSSGNRPSSSG